MKSNVKFDINCNDSMMIEACDSKFTSSRVINPNQLQQKLNEISFNGKHLLLSKCVFF